MSSPWRFVSLSLPLSLARKFIFFVTTTVLDCAFLSRHFLRRNAELDKDVVHKLESLYQGIKRDHGFIVR
jgi:hypothetical protein